MQRVMHGFPGVVVCPLWYRRPQVGKLQKVNCVSLSKQSYHIVSYRIFFAGAFSLQTQLVLLQSEGKNVKHESPVYQTMDSANRRINHYSAGG